MFLFMLMIEIYVFATFSYTMLNMIVLNWMYMYFNNWYIMSWMHCRCGMLLKSIILYNKLTTSLKYLFCNFRCSEIAYFINVIRAVHILAIRKRKKPPPMSSELIAKRMPYTNQEQTSFWTIYCIKKFIMFVMCDMK